MHFRTYPIPTPRGKSLSPGVDVFAMAFTKLVVSRATTFAGSSGKPVFVVYDRCVLLAAEKATAGI